MDQLQAQRKDAFGYVRNARMRSATWQIWLRPTSMVSGTERPAMALGCLPHGEMWGNVLHVATCYASFDEN